MDILKLIYEIRMTENGEQKFRNWLFGESSKIELKSEDVIQNTFGELRKIIVNNINVTDVYEATSEKCIYKNVMCDSFLAHNYSVDSTYIFMNILYLILNGILNLCYDEEHKVYFLSPITSMKEISNHKTWFSGSQYQIKHTYEYKKGKLIYKDLKVFTFTVNENITIKNILSNLAYS